jgi:hypothetical protein
VQGRSAELNRATVRSACPLQTLLLKKAPILISKTGSFFKINSASRALQIGTFLLGANA